MATTWSTSRFPNTTPDDYQRRKVAKIAIVAPAAADSRTGILMSSNSPAQLDLRRSPSAQKRPRSKHQRSVQCRRLGNALLEKRLLEKRLLGKRLLEKRPPAKRLLAKPR